MNADGRVGCSTKTLKLTMLVYSYNSNSDCFTYSDSALVMTSGGKVRDDLRWKNSGLLSCGDDVELELLSIADSKLLSEDTADMRRGYIG